MKTMNTIRRISQCSSRSWQQSSFICDVNKNSLIEEGKNPLFEIDRTKAPC